MPAIQVEKSTNLINTTCAVVRHELHETMKASLSMSSNENNNFALHDRLERIEMMLLNMQTRQEQQHAEMIARQEEQHAELLAIAERQKENHQEVMDVLHKVLAAVRMQTGVLQALLQGDSECPRCGSSPDLTDPASTHQVALCASLRGAAT